MARDEEGKVWGLTVAAWASLLVFATCSTLFSVSLKHMGTDLSMGLARRGSLAMARAGALALTTFVVGWMADRLGKKAFLAAAMFVIAAGLALTGASHTFAWLVMGVMCVGLGQGGLEALVSPLVAELHPRSIATQMSILHAFFPVGIVLSSLLIGASLDAGVPWQVPFRVAAVPALVVGAMFLACRHSSVRTGRRAAPLSVRQIAVNPMFRLLALGMMLGAGCEGGIFYWMPNFIQEEYGASATTGAMGLTLYSAAMAASRFSLGPVARRVSMRAILVGVAGLGAVASLGLVLTRGLASSFVLLFVTGFCVASFWPGMLSLAAEGIATGSTTLFAMLSAAGIVGFGLMPHLIGVVGGRFGLRAGLGIVPVAFLATALTVFAARKSLSGTNS